MQVENLNQDEKAEKIDEVISLITNYEDFSGSVLVAHEGEAIYKKGCEFVDVVKI